jgi:hypothetical protein
MASSLAVKPLFRLNWRMVLCFFPHLNIKNPPVL